jgi:hypothetical protein
MPTVMSRVRAGPGVYGSYGPGLGAGQAPSPVGVVGLSASVGGNADVQITGVLILLLVVGVLVLGRHTL